ncbi:NDP-hexose 2,3-dehydratase family protein [Streptomyces cucumeris]|uniref:NDP-hexose 2,3-dehydratase family protein n=1 Tax=Streptomyces cucumeris TaxID=2962890 RepID=UPI0020C89B61|nr:NDP-hexose 2,3-dehydratase family protein [Streptomyces sp. NEAU-Y11]MCP9210768.1 NDP-hexose 2,3-dehydratase family protein [Streptomyces sp. NEAU-Y11]
MVTALGERLVRSAAAVDGPAGRLSDVRHWFRERAAADTSRVEVIPFAELRGWSFAADTHNLVHETGRFFSVEGLRVRMPGAPVERWTQPILHQPEIGILGILVKDFGGVPHFLMQAKMEPGNHGGLQLSPTVQATRSNYTRVHRGRAVPYVEYFRRPDRHRVLADVRQSEQGTWFFRKRNRNMLVEVAADEDVEVRDGFHWLTLGQLHRLLAEEDLVNMDARSVLAGLPAMPGGGRSGERGSVHRSADILSWITGLRSDREVVTERIPLRATDRWHRTEGRISHESGRYFSVMAVDVRAGGREVGGWTQPMIEPHGPGVAAFLLACPGGVPHVLVQARAEPGYTDVVELAPTVQCTPRNYAQLPGAAAQRFLDEVTGAPPERVRFDTVLSEEGGRFYHAFNRYLVVESAMDIVPPDDPDFRWMSLHQLLELIPHSHYLNVEARTLMACLHSVLAN